MAKVERSPGVWQIKIYIGQDSEKNKKYEYFTFYGTYREAEAEEVRLKNLYGRRNSTITNLTVSALCDLYMENYVKINLREKTQSDYKLAIESRIKPLLGHKKAIKLTPMDVQYFIRETTTMRLDTKKTPISSRTVLKAFRALHSFLEWCRYTGYIQINPASAVKPPRSPQHVSKVLNFEQTIEFLVEAYKTSPRQYYLLYLLAIGTGARKSELLALRWSDINFEKGTIAIQKSFTRVSDEDLTKNASSNRTVQVPEFVLKDIKSDYFSIFNKDSLIFENINFDSMTKRDFKPLLKKLGLSKEIRFHDLRHSHASLLLLAGVDMKQIQSQMGHATIGTTFDIYAQLLANGVVANKLDLLLGEKLSENLQKTLKN